MPDLKANNPKPGYTEEPNQCADNPNLKHDIQASHNMGSIAGNLSELGRPSLELHLAVLQKLEMEEALPDHTSSSRDIPGLKLSVIRHIGILFQERYEQSMQPEDLDKAIEFATKGIQLTSDNDSNGAGWLGRLGILYHSRFQRLGDLGDLGRAIEFMGKAQLNTPFDHVDKPALLNNLGVSYRSLFQRLGRLEDLDKSFRCMDQAAMLTPDGHHDKPGQLSNLGTSYNLLFERLGRPDDLDKSVKCHEQAVRLIPDGHPDKPAALDNLGNSHHLLFERLGRLDDLEKAVNCREQAIISTLGGHPGRPGWLSNLGNSYHLLFEHLGRLDDLDKSANCQEQAVMLTPDGHPEKPTRLNNFGNSYQLLFEHLGRQDDLDKAVNYQEQAVMLTPDGHPDKPARLSNLGIAYQMLFKRLGRVDDLDKSINCLEQAVMLTPDGHFDKPGWLSNLGNSYQLLFRHLGRLDDLDKSVKCKEQVVMLTPDDHLKMPGCLRNLGDSYILIFQRLGRLEDANQAAGYLNQAAQLTPEGHPDKPLQLNSFGRLCEHMFTRWAVPAHGSDAMNFYRSAALMPTCVLSARLWSSHHWAQLSRLFDPFSLEGYMHCMMLLPLVVWLGTSVPQRHERLARLVGSLVTEAVAAAISLRRYDLAVEWLEQGRSVVWGQTLQLRTPYDGLHTINPEMAQELRDVSRQLESASMSNPAEQVPGQDSLSLHNVAWGHRRLAKRREELLASARLVPGLEDFLRPPNAPKLINMVRDGVVVMINVYKDRCDALVLHPIPPAITHVPLVGFSIQKAEQARNDLAKCLLACGSRRGVKKGGVASKTTFKDILAMLWHDVVKPVLEHLGIVQRPEGNDLPHITWCTTGYLSFLPLHAAGDYSNPSTILGNLAISSYIPTIGFLGQHASSTSTFSGILAVGHKSSVRNLIPLPGTKDELDQIQKWAEPLDFTRLDEEKACADTVLKEMGNHSWVHFACHASQNGMDPMKSALHLHDKDLDLATIARTPLKNAQLAFLSACQTATGDAALPDESVHLAAGLLMAGYQAVIATMWSISDQDAPIVAGKVYECLLEGGVADSRKAAKALHYAVAGLREKIGVDEFARWVPYIHIGR